MQSGRVFLAKYARGGEQEWIVRRGVGDEMVGGLATGLGRDGTGYVLLATYDGRREAKEPATLYRFDTRVGGLVWKRRIGEEKDPRPVLGLATDGTESLMYLALERYRHDFYPLHSREVERYFGPTGLDKFDRLPYGGELSRKVGNNMTVYYTKNRRDDVFRGSVPYDATSTSRHDWGVYLPSDVSVQAIAYEVSGGVYACGYRRVGPFCVRETFNDSSFIARYSQSGKLQWMQWHGEHEHDQSVGIAVDGRGNAYVVDLARGRTPQKANRGMFDVRLVKYDPNGKVLWMRQFGTSLLDVPFSVAVSPPFLPGGELRDAKAIYVTGVTQGDLGNENADLVQTEAKLSAFLVGYDLDGNRTFLEQFALGAVIPPEILDVCSVLWEDIPGADAAPALAGLAALLRGRPEMARSWWRRLPVSALVTTDDSGNVYLAGSSMTSLDPDYTNKGSADIFLMRFAPNPEVKE